MALRDELATMDALDQAALVRSREVSAVELVDAAIERIERVNPRLNAVISTRFDDARAEATAFDRDGLPESPLAGVPFLLKDIGAPMAAMPDAMGSRALRDRRPQEDGLLVRRYRRAGLVIAGRTSTPEFGNHSTTEPVLYGPTRNPWNTALTAGGSSGGAAAAVASGMVPAAHGGDGAGSLRIPASCCGVFGLKPSRGRVSRAPAGEEIGGLNVRHAVSRSVRDSAALLDAIAGREPGDPYTAPKPERPFLAEVGADPGPLRIGWSATPSIDTPVDRDCVVAVEAAASLLSSLGHRVEEARPTFDGEVLVGPLLTVWAVSNADDAAYCERVLGRALEPDELEETTWELVEYGRSRTASDLMGAVASFGAACRSIGPFFEQYDIWLTPTLARRPEPLGVLNRSRGGALAWQRMDSEFNPWNAVANITGQPAMSLPLHWTDDGLPIGVLATGRYADEATLYRLAGQLEAARPWAHRLPPVHASSES